MSKYSSKILPAGSHFFTARLLDRHGDTFVREIEHLRDATRAMLRSFPTHIEAVVVLPSVIHTIWSLPAGDQMISQRWDVIKAAFSDSIIAGPNRRKIWQKRVWQHKVQDEHDFRALRQLIITAPVDYGYVQHPEDWLYSSVHKDRAAGIFALRNHLSQSLHYSDPLS